MRVQYNHKINRDLLERIKALVDGIRYRSPNQIMEIACLEWVIKEERKREREQARKADS